MDHSELCDAEEQLEIQVEVLERLRCFLCQKLVADRHVDFLRSRHVLSREDVEDICSHASSSRRAGRMLDYISKVPQGLGALLASIRSWRTQDFVAERIVRELNAVQRDMGGAEKEMLEVKTSTTNSHYCCPSLPCSDLKESTLAPSCCLSDDYPSSLNSEPFPLRPSGMGNVREELFSERTEQASSTSNQVRSIGDTNLRELGPPLATSPFPLSLHSWQTI